MFILQKSPVSNFECAVINTESIILKFGVLWREQKV